MYFLMMPLSLRGGIQETYTTELLEAAAFTPAGGPGTGMDGNKSNSEKEMKMKSYREGGIP